MLKGAEKRAQSRGRRVADALVQYAIALNYRDFPHLSPTIYVDKVNPQDEHFVDYPIEKAYPTATSTVAWRVVLSFRDLISEKWEKELRDAPPNVDYAPDEESLKLLDDAWQYYLTLDAAVNRISPNYVEGYMIQQQVPSIKKGRGERWVDYKHTIGFDPQFVPLNVYKDWKKRLKGWRK
jgi:hypothetical protein